MDWNVLGHEWAVSLLQQHIARQDQRHAYLFTGPQGVGRRTLALRFAQALNCIQPPEPGAPCMVCRMCQQIQDMKQVDLSIVQSMDDEGQFEDSASIKVEQIRVLQHTLSLAPYEARYRVALLLRFHQATESAQNALLKTLEEAPSRVVLVLTADTTESLLPTIVSRTEILRLRPLSLDTLSRFLQDEKNLSAEKARLLAHISGGRIGYATHLSEHAEMMEQRHTFIEDLFRLLTSSRCQRMAYAETIANNKDKTKQKIRYLLYVWSSLWRDVLLCSYGCETQIVNIDWMADIKRISKHVNSGSARVQTANMEQSMAYLDTNVNPRLLIEVMLLDLPH